MRRDRKGVRVFAALLLASAACACGQAQARDWNKPFPPHKVIGNVYFVGTGELGSFLITTPQGNILINSDFETTVPFLKANIEKLGFKFSDTRILLGSHAHSDHMEGDAMVKELTGAKVMAMEQDVPALRKMKPGGKEHPIDRILKDGDEVKTRRDDAGRASNRRPYQGMHIVDPEDEGGREDLRRYHPWQHRVESRIHSGEQQGLSDDRRRLCAQLRNAAEDACRRVPRVARQLL
jgi:hypothetical protein